MGKQAKLKRVRRIRRELNAILQLGLETGNIIEDGEGNLKFQNEMLSQQFFLRLLSTPEIMYDFIEENPEFLEELIEAIKPEYEDDDEDDDEDDEDDDEDDEDDED